MTTTPSKKRRSATYCRQCHAPIRFALTTSGKWIPLDESPDPAGRWVIEPGRRSRQLMGVELEHARESGALLFTNHLAGCVGRSSATGGACPPHLREALGLKPKGARGG